MKVKKRAIVLLSGGLDSATCLAVAQRDGFECYTLSFDYGQRHKCELQASEKLAAAMGAVEHKTFKLDLRQWGGSALTDDNIAVPDGGGAGIPVTYVPARNLIFLSLATAWGEVLGAHDIFIGVNSVDYSGYPDCRAGFIAAFAEAARRGTCAVDENWHWSIHTPLQNLSKAEIIQLGTSLKVDYSLTTSCYNPDQAGRSCGKCDSCLLRHQGFIDAGVADPTVYQQ
ncbi:MAG: 7-cyano-7-deazaguanine synthase QueC [Lentisphaerae bacterium]|nr:7-cyano-7-deazaguanine synthase QueC [Lentisphaerota bacterium]